MEVWKDVIGYEGLYQVSNLGRVKSYPKKWYCGNGMNNLKFHNGILLKTHVTYNGYAKVALCKKGKNKHLLIHRLIAEAFIANIDKKPCVNHINGIKTDNRIENLEWATYSENTKHSFKNKFQVIKKGKDHYFYGRNGFLSNRGKIVLNTQNGIFYGSIIEAANSIGMNKITLTNKLNGIYKNNTPFILA